jgi:signal transduction histidine kinase
LWPSVVRSTTIGVCVEDDGVSFGVTTPTFAYGLSGMRERVAALGGELHLDNQPPVARAWWPHSRSN